MPTAIEDLARLRAMCDSGEARDIRQRARVSQIELADEVGTLASNISRWETGERRPTGRVAVRYFRALESLREITS